MSEAVFPILGPLFVIVMVLPLSALLARLVLSALSSFALTSGLSSHQSLRYAILVGSSAIPLSWFISASLHQAESGESAVVCTADHIPGSDCAESAYFSLGLCALVLLIALPRLLRDHLAVRALDTDRERRIRTRVEAIVAARPGLSALLGHIALSDGARVPIATVGILSSHVVVQTAYAESVDDEALAGALYHELEHFSDHDPLRYFVGWWALAVNPLGGWLLRAEHARWILGREAHCDRQAVLAGASATALAKALVVAAKPPLSLGRPMLGSGHIEAIKLRLGLLLAYADRKPHPFRQRPVLRWLLIGVVVSLALPHNTPTHPLDLLHAATEGGIALIARD